MSFVLFYLAVHTSFSEGIDSCFGCLPLLLFVCSLEKRQHNATQTLLKLLDMSECPTLVS